LWHQEETLENKMDRDKNNLNESVEEQAEINDNEQPAVATGYSFSTSTHGVWHLTTVTAESVAPRRGS